MNDVSKAKKPIFKKWWFWLIVVIVLLVIIIPKDNEQSTASNTTENVAQEQPAFELEVTASTLFDEYQDNEVSADNKYKGKIILVDGTVQQVRKDFMDNMIVELTTSNQFMPINCYFENADVVASLSKGNNIKIIGKVDGITIGIVKIEDCVIQE